MTETPQTAIRIRVVRHRSARVDHYFMRKSVIRRFVVLEAKSLREFLEKQRRTEIDPLDLSDADADLTSGDIWELAERTAKVMLRELYRKVAETKVCKAAQALEDKHDEAQQILGKQLVPYAAKDTVAGTLIFAGMRPDVPYCIEMLTEDGHVRRVMGIDLARALEVSGAQVGESISVAKVAKHNVSVTERRTGSHGSGKRSSKRSRVLFEITKEVNHEPTDSRREHGPRSSTDGNTDVQYGSM
ncbi:MAG: hypothetical protein ACR2PS_11315 [Pseudomonadales bacterium]